MLGIRIRSLPEHQDVTACVCARLHPVSCLRLSAPGDEGRSDALPRLFPPPGEGLPWKRCVLRASSARAPGWPSGSRARALSGSEDLRSDSPLIQGHKTIPPADELTFRGKCSPLSASTCPVCPAGVPMWTRPILQGHVREARPEVQCWPGRGSLRGRVKTGLLKPLPLR